MSCIEVARSLVVLDRSTLSTNAAAATSPERSFGQGLEINSNDSSNHWTGRVQGAVGATTRPAMGDTAGATTGAPTEATALESVITIPVQRQSGPWRNLSAFGEDCMAEQRSSNENSNEEICSINIDDMSLCIPISTENEQEKPPDRDGENVVPRCFCGHSLAAALDGPAPRRGDASEGIHTATQTGDYIAEEDEAYKRSFGLPDYKDQTSGRNRTRTRAAPAPPIRSPPMVPCTVINNFFDDDTVLTKGSRIFHPRQQTPPILPQEPERYLPPENNGIVPLRPILVPSRLILEQCCIPHADAVSVAACATLAPETGNSMANRHRQRLQFPYGPRSRVEMSTVGINAHNSNQRRRSRRQRGSNRRDGNPSRANYDDGAGSGDGGGDGESNDSLPSSHEPQHAQAHALPCQSCATSTRRRWRILRALLRWLRREDVQRMHACMHIEMARILQCIQQDNKANLSMLLRQIESSVLSASQPLQALEEPLQPTTQPHDGASTGNSTTQTEDGAVPEQDEALNLELEDPPGVNLSCSYYVASPPARIGPRGADADGGNQEAPPSGPKVGEANDADAAEEESAGLMVDEPVDNIFGEAVAPAEVVEGENATGGPVEPIVYEAVDSDEVARDESIDNAVGDVVAREEEVVAMENGTGGPVEPIVYEAVDRDEVAHDDPVDNGVAPEEEVVAMENVARGPVEPIVFEGVACDEVARAEPVDNVVGEVIAPEEVVAMENAAGRAVEPIVYEAVGRDEVARVASIDNAVGAPEEEVMAMENVAGGLVAEEVDLVVVDAAAERELLLEEAAVVGPVSNLVRDIAAPEEEVVAEAAEPIVVNEAAERELNLDGDAAVEPIINVAGEVDVHDGEFVAAENATQGCVAGALDDPQPADASGLVYPSVFEMLQNSPSLITTEQARRSSRILSSTSTYRRDLFGRCLSCGTDVAVPQFPSLGQLRHGIVQLAFLDCHNERVYNGSGFILDAKLGLIATCAHLVYNMTTGEPKVLGSPITLLVGVFDGVEGPSAFRYKASVVPDQDVCRIDACIIKIDTRLDTDVRTADFFESALTGDPFSPLDLQHVRPFKLSTSSRIGEYVQIVGVNQSTECSHLPENYICRREDVARGYITRNNFPKSDLPFETSLTAIQGCRSIKGHSGGAVLDTQLGIVGILSQGDPDDIIDPNQYRDYIVPISEIMPMIRRAFAKDNAEMPLIVE